MVSCTEYLSCSIFIILYVQWEAHSMQISLRRRCFAKAL